MTRYITPGNVGHGVACAGTIPVIAGAPIEEHLRTAFKKSSRHGSQDSRAGALLPPIKHTSRSTVPPPAGAVQQQGPHGAGEPNDSLGVTAPDAAAPLKPEPHGTGHHSGPYKSEVMLPGLNVVVPRHLTLRQSVPYDSVRQAELLEAKVSETIHHPGATGAGRYGSVVFVNDCGTGAIRLLPTHTHHLAGDQGRDAHPPSSAIHVCHSQASPPSHSRAEQPQHGEIPGPMGKEGQPGQTAVHAAYNNVSCISCRLLLLLQDPTLVRPG
jgi:hypothetical protein